MAERDDEHFIQSFYQLLALIGIDPNRVAINYVLDEEHPEQGSLAIALPDTKVGFALDGDVPGPFDNDNWYVLPISVKQLELFHNMFRNVESIGIEDQNRRLMDTTKQVSRQENILLDELMKRHLPVPDRNYRIDRDDGRELTTPDFTWPDLKIAFFVDGLWWHVGREDKERLDQLKKVAQNDDSGFLEANKTRVEKDLRIRSQLQARGWITPACTDRDLSTHRGVQEQADYIEDLITNTIKENEAFASSKSNKDDDGNDDFDPLSLLD